MSPHLEGNGHMYFLILKDLEERTRLIEHLKASGIMAVFHYVPLHSSPAGRKYARVHGEMTFTEELSDRLVRLPVFHDLSEEEIARVATAIRSFFVK